MFKSKWIITLVLFAAATASTPASSDYIKHSYWVTDTSTGLDWLDTSLTLGKSALDVYEETMSGSLTGWRVASYEDWSRLIGQFDGKDEPYTPGSGGSRADHNNQLGIGNGEPELNEFVDIFGIRDAWYGLEENDIPPCFGDPFGTTDGEPCGYIGHVTLVLDYYYGYDEIDIIIDDTGSLPAWVSFPGTAVLVVRDSLTVAEPPAWSLLVSGMFAFLLLVTGLGRGPLRQRWSKSTTTSSLIG